MGFRLMRKGMLCLLVSLVGIMSVPIIASADTLWSIGDSTAVGWDGHKIVTAPYPLVAADKLHVTAHNEYSVSGAMISGHSTYQRDFSATTQLISKDKTFKTANLVLIGLGINDYLHSDNALPVVIRTLQHNVRQLKALAPQTKFYALMPQGTWEDGDTLNTIRLGGYSYLQEKQALLLAYQQLGVKPIDARVVNNFNYHKELGDHTTHPTQAAYYKIGEAVAKQIAGDGYTAKTYTGWRDKRYYIADKLANGLQTTVEGYRYFDDGVALKSRWLKRDGKTYYLAKNGAPAQGNILINHKVYAISTTSNGSNQLTDTFASRGLVKDAYVMVKDEAGRKVGWRWIKDGRLYTGEKTVNYKVYTYKNGVRQAATDGLPIK